MDGGVTLSVYEQTGSMCRAVAQGNAIGMKLKAAGIPIRISTHMD